MELNIKISDDAEVESIIELKRLIDQASIYGLEKADVARDKPAPNQRGAGQIFNLLTVIIKADIKPLTDLVKTLQAFVTGYGVSLDVNIIGGKNMKVSEGGGIAAEALAAVILQ